MVMANSTSSSLSSGRLAGGFLILTALITAVMAWARVSSEADLPTITQTLNAIRLNAETYGLSGAARFASGLTLMAAAWCLGKTWIIEQRLGSPTVPRLLGVSGGFTAISGLAALGLAMWTTTVSSDSLQNIDAGSEFALLARWLSGKIGFAVAGLALMLASRYQWKVGGALRRMAPGSAVIGAAMQFIWVDSATMVHPVVGAAFFLWLVAVGVMLFTGRTERLFAEMVERNPASETSPLE